MIAAGPKPFTGNAADGAHLPFWATETVQASAVVGLVAHAYLWWRVYHITHLPTADRWLDGRLVVIPFVLGLAVLFAAYRRCPWACLILLGATFLGLLGGITWLAGAFRGEDVLSASGAVNAVDRSVFFLLPSFIALPLAAACSRLGMLRDSAAGDKPESLAL